MGDAAAASIVASGVLDSLVLLFFVFRLWIRIRMQRVGWEDIWATVAFVCGVINIACDWVSLARLDAGTGQLSMISMWTYIFTFTCLVWAVRISIIFSIIRILPAGERLYIYGLMIITLFLLTCSALIVQKAITCTNAYHAFQPTPSHPYFHCGTIRTLSISELAVGSLADIVVTVFPLYVLRGVTLSSRQLRLLRLLFSSNISVSIVYCLRAVDQAAPALSRWSPVIFHLQTAICLIVCNLLVVVTYLYRVLGFQKHTSMTNDTPEKVTTRRHTDRSATLSVPRQMTLTTIELLFSAQSHERTPVATGGTVASGC